MCGVSGTTMTSVAEALQTEGLVERVRNPADRRSYSLTRTTAGRAAVRRWAPHVRRLEQRLTADFTPAQVARLPGAAHQAGRRRSSTSAHPRPCAPAPASCSPARTSACTGSSSPRSPRSASSPATSAPCAPSPPPAPSPRATSAQLLDVSPATVVQMVDHLENAGLVTRERDPFDRRAYLLHLQPAAAARRRAGGPDRRRHHEREARWPRQPGPARPGRPAPHFRDVRRIGLRPISPPSRGAG